MNKAYQRINGGKGWVDYPSDDTAVNAYHLNHMEVGIDEADTRIVVLDETKATKLEVSTLFSDVEFERQTGILTFTRKNGATVVIDTPMEKIQTGIYYNPVTEKLALPLIDGTTIEVDLSRLMKYDEFLDSDTIAFSVKPDGKITAIIKKGSVTEEHLRPDYLADIRIEEGKAAASREAAEASATESESYAHGGTNTRPNEDTDNAMAYAQNAKEYADSWKGSLLPQGSVAFSQLPTSGNVKGYMYNVNDAFVTDSRFKEEAGFSYPAGTNVYWTSDGKWDCLSGVLTKEVTQAEYDALPEAEKMSGTIYYILDADNTLGSATDTVPGVVVVDKSLSATSENPVQNKAVKAAIDLKANLASPALTGTPTAPTPQQSSNDTRIATTGFVKSVINALIDGAPETLDTLKEIADALAANETVVNALDAAIGNKVDKIAGKGLSANDFTTTEKNKLSGIADNANNYSLPLASSATRGGVKTGYSQNGKNYPVQLSNEQMYVNVPWTDTQIITGVKGNVESSYRTGNVNITPANIGLGNVNNTADIDKLVSRANRMFMPRVTEDPSDMTVYDTANFVVREYPYTGNTQTGLPSGYFYHILTGRSPDEKYATQLALGMTIGELYYRNMYNGTWSEWKKIFNSGNISTVTPANIGAFPSSGGTLSGSLTVTGDTTLQGNVRIKKASSGYGSVINIGDGDYIRISEETDDVLTVKAKQININSSNANAVYINGQLALRYKTLTQTQYNALASTKNSDNVLYFITD